jgi:hypothetical protein
MQYSLDCIEYHFGPRPYSAYLSSNTNDTAGYQFLDLALDSWILHVLLKSGWVVLRLLKDAVHDWILHNAENLQVCQ